MCGIVGYVGDKDILSVLIVGLERLSYRGYDSPELLLLLMRKSVFGNVLVKFMFLRKNWNLKIPMQPLVLGIPDGRPMGFLTKLMLTHILTPNGDFQLFIMALLKTICS